MYAVTSRFHELALSGERTRCRIYLFGNNVNYTDDNDVELNGELLKMLPTDTDSNARIRESGIGYTNYFNKDKNLQIGGTVSSQIAFEIVNTDGAYTGYNFSRCKVFIDIYDSANGVWLPCPIGVFMIRQPDQTYGSVISITGYDMMQELNGIADTWFNGIDWTDGVSLSDLASDMADYFEPDIADRMAVNTMFTAAPFVSNNYTYRDILTWIAEASGTIAYMTRDGRLDLKWFDPVSYSRAIDQIGSGVFDCAIAEYSAARIYSVLVQSLNLDSPVRVGSGSNAYRISGNPFIADDTEAAITTKATPILTRIQSLGSYTPISLTMVTDWSIEAGDIITVSKGGTTYDLPIFQQTMTWRGAYVMSTLFSSGDYLMPTAEPEQERTEYRTQKQINERVTFTSLSTPGETVIDGGNITTGELSADRIKGGTLTLGGSNNEDGSISILDANGTVIGTVNNEGIRMHNYDSTLGVDQYTDIFPAQIRLTTGSTISVLLNRFSDGTGSLTVRDANGVTRVAVGGNSNGNVEIRNTDGTSASRMRSQRFSQFYRDTAAHYAVDLGNDDTRSYLTLNSPDGASDIFIDTLNGCRFNSPVTCNGGFKIGNTSLTETQLQQLLALIS